MISYIHVYAYVDKAYKDMQVSPSQHLVLSTNDIFALKIRLVVVEPKALLKQAGCMLQNEGGIFPRNA